MKTYAVIGLGRFGAAAAARLEELGNEVLAIDTSEELVQRLADRVTHAVVGDARDEAVLRSLGVRGVGSPPSTSGQTGISSNRSARAQTASFFFDLPS